MKLDDIQSVLKGNIEAINQGKTLIESMSDEQYQYIAHPFVKSSIGQHFRHIIDVFFSLVNASRVGCVDYDVRRRGDKAETHRQEAIEQLTRIEHWMNRVMLSDTEALLASITVKTEVTLEQTHSVTMPTSLLREFVFTSSHAVHHFALISVIAKIQGLKLDDKVGVAPATATFLRSSECEETEGLCAP